MHHEREPRCRPRHLRVADRLRAGIKAPCDRDSDGGDDREERDRRRRDCRRLSRSNPVPPGHRVGRCRGEAGDEAGRALLDRLDDQAGDRRRRADAAGRRQAIGQRPGREVFAGVRRPEDAIGQTGQPHDHTDPHAHVGPRRGYGSSRARGQDAQRSRPALARRPDAGRARRTLESPHRVASMPGRGSSRS